MAKIVHIMEKFIGIPFKPLLDDFPTIKGMLNRLKSVFLVEDNLFKLSQRSILTETIARLNETRVAYFIFVRRCIDMVQYAGAPEIKPAVDRIKFLYNTYKGLPEQNYYDMSGTMTNFLQDCEIPVNREAILFLSSAMLIDLRHLPP